MEEPKTKMKSWKNIFRKIKTFQLKKQIHTLTIWVTIIIMNQNKQMMISTEREIKKIISKILMETISF